MAAWLGMAAGSLALGFMEPGGSFCLNSICLYQKAARNNTEGGPHRAVNACYLHVTDVSLPHARDIAAGNCQNLCAWGAANPYI